VTLRRRKEKQQKAVVSTVVFHCKEMAVAVTHSTIHRRATILLSNNPGVRKMVTTKIPSRSLLLAGNHLLRVLITLRVGLPHHLLAHMGLTEEGRCNRRLVTHNPKLMATTRLVGALQAMVSLKIVADLGIHIGEKMEIRTEDSEIHIVDIEVVERVPDTW
jgi:hypothetical protein